MNGFTLAAVTAAWLGVLTSISPCPLATNIAAVSFVGRKVGSVKSVLLSGILYTLGRILTYTVLSACLVSGMVAMPAISQVLQKYMNLLMGPLLILVAMVLLGLLHLPLSGGDSGMGESLRARIERLGVFGALPLGFFFALSLCPTSAALFFGSLMPLAVKFQSRLVLPGIYGLATGFPVLVFAFLLAFSARKVATAYNRLAAFEIWAQRATGILFLLVGIYMTVTVTLGICFR
jgi:cytochrome c-type biogenesis protein